MRFLEIALCSKMSFYKLIDIAVYAELNQELNKIWKPFQKQGYENIPDIKLEWNISSKDFGDMQVLMPEYHSYTLKKESDILFVNSDWSKSVIYSDNTDSASVLLIYLFYSYLITRRTLLIHSSLIDHHGNGIMFLGPSGIGKTTQAELWNRYRGADILNGDMVFVRQWEDGFYGYGSPWHGSSPYYKNAKVKLKAMITLEQAPENSIRKLSGFEVLQGMMDQVFLPHWYPEAMDDCLSTLDALLSEVPIYHLACRPDEAAVRLVVQELGL